MIVESAESTIGQPIESPASGSLPPVCRNPSGQMKIPGGANRECDTPMASDGRGTKNDHGQSAGCQGLNSLFSSFDRAGRNAAFF